MPNSSIPANRSARSRAASRSPSSAAARRLDSSRAVTGSGSSSTQAWTREPRSSSSVTRHPLYDVGEQPAAPFGGGLAGLDDLLVRQRLVRDAGGQVGHQGDAENLQADVPGGDRVQRRRHADEVAAHALGHLHLGRGLVVRSAELHVDALVESRVDLAGDRPQPGGVEVGEVDEGRTLERRRRREVDVVPDEDRGPRPPGRVEAPAAVGENDGRAAGLARGADRVDHGPDTAALVEVRARPVDQRPAAGVTDGDRPHTPAVSGHRGGLEAGHVGVVDGRDGRPDEVGRLAPAGPEDEGDVVSRRSGALGDDGGGGLGDVEGVGARVVEIHAHAHEP